MLFLDLDTRMRTRECGHENVNASVDTTANVNAAAATETATMTIRFDTNKFATLREPPSRHDVMRSSQEPRSISKANVLHGVRQ